MLLWNEHSIPSQKRIHSVSYITPTRWHSWNSFPSQEFSLSSGLCTSQIPQVSTDMSMSCCFQTLFWNINGHSCAGRKEPCQCQKRHKERLTLRKDDTANLLHQSEIPSIKTAAHSPKNPFHCLIPHTQVTAQGCKGQVMGDMEKHLKEAPESTVNNFTAKCELKTTVEELRSTWLDQKQF